MLLTDDVFLSLESTLLIPGDRREGGGQRRRETSEVGMIEREDEIKKGRMKGGEQKGRKGEV